MFVNSTDLGMLFFPSQTHYRRFLVSMQKDKRSRYIVVTSRPDFPALLKSKLKFGSR